MTTCRPLPEVVTSRVMPLPRWRGMLCLLWQASAPKTHPASLHRLQGLIMVSECVVCRYGRVAGQWDAGWHAGH